MKPGGDITEFPHGGIALPPLADRAASLAAPLAAPRIVLSPSTWRVRDFYELTKPRMNLLVVITTLVGFYMAIGRVAQINWLLLLHTIVGTALTAAGASILNQYVEREHDLKMPRTSDRPIPAGRILPMEALVLGVMLGAGGVLYLAAFVNTLTSLLGALTL